MLGRMSNLIDRARLYAVQHPGQHGARRLPNDAEDDDCNQQANDRIGKRIPDPYAKRADNHGEACQPVGASMIAIGDQRRAVDFAADTDSETPRRVRSRQIR